MTAKSLENAAAYYLQRFASSTANFRQVMMRRVARAARFHGSDAEEGAKLVEDLVQRFTENEYLNDQAYAEMLAGGLHRRGGSARAIRVKLMQKGLDAETIEGALSGLSEETEEPELAAAQVLARKRRLGPYRDKGLRADMREKDLAALARAGFAYDMALKVIDAETVLELEEEVEALRL